MWTQRSLASFFLFLLLSLGACTKKAPAEAPENIAGKLLEGKRTSGQGAFAGDGGYAFSAHFDANSQFRILGPEGNLEDTGVYRFKKLGPDSATLILSATTGARSGAELTVNLKFTSPEAGAYEARATKGEPGEQTGTFELK